MGSRKRQRRKNNEMLLVENRTFISVAHFKKEKKVQKEKEMMERRVSEKR